MDMKTWAENEVRLAFEEASGDVEDGGATYKCLVSALNAFKSLCDDQHSGGRMAFTMNILNRLIDGKPLIPITEENADWEFAFNMEETGDKVYQSKRCSSLFKHVLMNGEVKYSDIDRVVVIEYDSWTTWHCGFITNMINEMEPISFPYMPSDRKYRVYRRSFSTEGKVGEYDTMHVKYYIPPDGKSVGIDKFFKENDRGFVEILREEYVERALKYKENGGELDVF